MELDKWIIRNGQTKPHSDTDSNNNPPPIQSTESSDSDCQPVNAKKPKTDTTSCAKDKKKYITSKVSG